MKEEDKYYATHSYTKKSLAGCQFTADDWLAGAIPLKQIAEERGISQEEALEILTDWELITLEEASQIHYHKSKTYWLAIDQTVNRIMESAAKSIKSAEHPERYIKQEISKLQKILDLHPELMEPIYLTGGHPARNYQGVLPETVREVMENEKHERSGIIDICDWDYAIGKPIENKSFDLAVKFNVQQRLESWLEELKNPKPKRPGRPPTNPKLTEFCISFYKSNRVKIDQIASNISAAEAARFVERAMKKKYPDEPWYPNPSTICKDILKLTS